MYHNSISLTPFFQYPSEITYYSQFYRNTWLSFLAEVGGYLGLCLGICGITFVNCIQGCLESAEEQYRASREEEALAYIAKKRRRSDKSAKKLSTML